MEQRGEQPGKGGSEAPPLWLNQGNREANGLSRPGSVGLVAGNRADGLAVLHELGRVFGSVPVSLTEVALSEPSICRGEELTERLADCPLLFDLETLCWNQGLGIDPLRFLRLHARKLGVVAFWPGRITGSTATFSVPGRRDHQRVVLAKLSVVRPVPTRFPDEVPFRVERIP